MLGNGRLNAKCTDFVFRNCVIRGKFKKRVWINPGDVILVEKDPFKKDRGMVVLKYFPEEVKALQKMDALTFEKQVVADKDDDGDDGWFDDPKPK
jgi:translation initiation factor 1A